jgi:FtsH-binding integral membrane protein
MTIPSELFTIDSFATLAGCTAIVYIVTGVIGYLMNFKTSQAVKKWLSIGLSLAVAFVAASLTEDKTAYTWILAIFNGFLIFVAATGTNAIFSSKETVETTESIATAATTSTAKSGNSATGDKTKYRVKVNGAIGMESNASGRKGKFSDKWW